MSLQSLLSIARSAILTHQRAMGVTAHNIANANTPGYTRQRLELNAEMPMRGALYPLGRGVTATGIARTRDSFYDATFRTDSGGMGLAGTLYDYLGRIEATLQEPSSSGLSSTLDGFFRSFADLGNDPSSGPNREIVRQSAGRLVAQMRSMANTLARVRQDALDDLRVQVDQANALAGQIADLNGRILASSGAGGVAPDLMDQRDVLIDQLSQLMEVRVMPRSDGTVGIQAGDLMLLDGNQAKSLEVTTVGSGFGLQTTTGVAVEARAGSLHALTDLTQNRLPAVQQSLDDMASALVSELNALHRSGFTASGATNVDFFDPSGTTASTIQLSAAVSASSDQIAAASIAASGDGSLAVRIAGLAGTALGSLGGRTLREHFVTLAAGVGIQVRGASQEFEASVVLVERSDQARAAVSGVSVDEEMVTLISQQQAYQAAARLISVADELVADLMRIL